MTDPAIGQPRSRYGGKPANPTPAEIQRDREAAERAEADLAAAAARHGVPEGKIVLATSQEMVLAGANGSSKEIAVRTPRTAEQYLAAPAKWSDDLGVWIEGAWKDSSEQGRAASAALAGAIDTWPTKNDGQPMPIKLRGRLLKEAENAAKDGAAPLLVVKCAMGASVVHHDFVQIWTSIYGTPPSPQAITSVVLESFEMLARGYGWTPVTDAVRLAASEGHAFVQRAYTDVTTAGVRQAPRNRQAPTQGEVHLSAIEKARKIMEAREAQNGTAA